MDRRFGRRPVAAFAISIVALGAMAVPAAAGSGVATRWVDDDGSAGPSACGGSRNAKSTIQSAVNASDTNDVIIVCPGTYTEDVDITGSRNGLVIRALDKWTAIVRAPSDLQGALIHVGGPDRVTIQGLQLVFPTSGCDERDDDVDAIVGEGADRLTVRANHLRPSGQATLGDCGYTDGIQVDGSRNVLVHSNLIEDFQSDGILFEGDSSGTITGNSVRFFHVGQPAEDGDEGIDIDDSAPVTITNNIVRSLRTVSHSSASLDLGIEVNDSDGAIIRNNVVKGAFFGIELDGDDGQIRNNRATGFREGPGIYITGGSGSVIRNNVIRTFYNGIDAQAGGNTFRDNDSDQSVEWDCLDDTSGGGTAGTDNTWVDNVGDPATPGAICQPEAI